MGDSDRLRIIRNNPHIKMKKTEVADQLEPQAENGRRMIDDISLQTLLSAQRPDNETTGI